MSTARAVRNRRRSNIVPLPQTKRVGLSPRAYQARLDLGRLWDLVCMQKSQAEIAQEMGKDPAWVSRSIKRLQADFFTVFPTAAENQLVTENLARFESLYAEALKTAFSSQGHSRISGLRLVAELLRSIAEYQVTVGYVANRRTGAVEPQGPTIADIRDEVSEEDLNVIMGTIMRKQGWRPLGELAASA